MGAKTISDYHAGLDASDRVICDLLRTEIAAGLPDAEAKFWHAHPVWFLDDNPIVGYSKLKTCIRLMFWSGQSLDAPGLAPTGTFKAAEARFTAADRIDADILQEWLSEGRRNQWDYKNIVRRKVRMDRLI